MPIEKAKKFFRPISDTNDASFWASVRSSTSAEHKLTIIPSENVKEYIQFRETIQKNMIKKLMYTGNTIQILRKAKKTGLIKELEENHVNAEEVFLKTRDELLSLESVMEFPHDCSTHKDVNDFITSLEGKTKIICLTQKKYNRKGPSQTVKTVLSICKEVEKEIIIIGCLFNKQKEEMGHELYFSSSIAFKFQQCLVENNKWKGFDYDPGVFPLITDDNGQPIYTMSRRMDGAYPNSVNPSILWEAKEYYDNKTYGSRVNDSIFETILSGKECLEVTKLFPGKSIKHFLFADGFYCLGVLGRALLLRYIDCFFQNMVDDIIVGSDIVKIWPAIANKLISGEKMQRGMSLFSGL